MSPALSPQIPFSAISTTSPRSTMLFMTQSIAAWPVADRANVTGFAVCRINIIDELNTKHILL